MQPHKKQHTLPARPNFPLADCQPGGNQNYYFKIPREPQPLQAPRIVYGAYGAFVPLPVSSFDRSCFGDSR